MQEIKFNLIKVFGKQREVEEVYKELEESGRAIDEIPRGPTELDEDYGLCKYDQTYVCEIYHKLPTKEKAKCSSDCILLKDLTIEKRLRQKKISRVSLKQFIEAASTHTLDIAPSAFGEEDCCDTADPEVWTTYIRDLRKKV